LIGIAYLSTAVQVPTVQDIEDILASSQRKNAGVGVTGLLCHHEGSFLQFLEGPGPAVDATFERISVDRRHRSVLPLYREPRSERLFAHWTMAVVQPGALSQEVGPFTRGLRDLEIGLTDAHVRAIEPFLDIFRAWLR
jgi:hypothetical protein